MSDYDRALGQWAASVPDSIQRDPLWRMRVYRLALFASDSGWGDVSRLSQDGRTRKVADQLSRALGSISANIAEGYSRGSGRDRARFYEYALGAAREARDWYFQVRHVLGPERTGDQMNLLAEIIRQLLVVIQKQSGRTLREPSVEYDLTNDLDA